MAPVGKRGMNLRIPLFDPLVFRRFAHRTVKMLGKLGRPSRSMADAVCCKEKVEHLLDLELDC